MLAYTFFPQAQKFASSGYSASWDLLLVIIFFVGLFIYGLMRGRGQLINIIISTYFSLIVINFFPWQYLVEQGFISKEPSLLAQVFCFLAVILAFVFLLPRSAISASVKSGRYSKNAWLQNVVFSFCTTGLLTSSIISLLPEDIFFEINSMLLKLFAGSMPKFMWLILPMFILMVLGRGEAD